MNCRAVLRDSQAPRQSRCHAGAVGRIAAASPVIAYTPDNATHRGALPLADERALKSRVQCTQGPAPVCVAAAQKVGFQLGVTRRAAR